MKASAVVGPEARTVHLNVERTTQSDGGSYPLFIDWGDGTAQQTVASGAASDDLTHQYAKAGLYKIVGQGDARFELPVSADYLPPAHGAAELERIARARADAAVIGSTTSVLG